MRQLPAQGRAARSVPTQSLFSRRPAVIEKVKDGSIITRFAATPPPDRPDDIVCPHFLELKWATGCPFACAWCYLQGTFRFLPYKTRPRVKPAEKIAQHLLQFWTSNSQPEILNAGELSDALMGERNGFSLVRFVSDLIQEAGPHRVLLVSKSDWIENLLDVHRPDLFVASFSINPREVAGRWEIGAPPPDARLDAAAKLAQAGYEVRLRIDPMVPVDGWERQYSRLLDAVFSRFVPSRITLGSLRGLQSTINKARDKSWTAFLGENSRWGKRVPMSVRLRMFEVMIARLREEFAFGQVALCKEPVATWQQLGMDWRNVRCNCTW
ncbi:MAG: hypothetical protein H5T86_06495 [Armatimonadetes bacterium]|nr:hypothetical protein [Armatimonadota bacterium]